MGEKQTRLSPRKRRKADTAVFCLPLFEHEVGLDYAFAVDGLEVVVHGNDVVAGLAAV